MSLRILAALVCGGLLSFVASNASAAGSLSGVGVTIRDSNGEIVGEGETDGHGAARIHVAAGDVNGDGRDDDYTLEIDGNSLARVADRVLANGPARRDDGPSVSIGVGGFLGGGSDHGRSTHDGAGPSHEGGTPGHGHSHSGGGVGLGLSIPLGGGHGDDSDAPAGYPITGITISLPANPDNRTADGGTSLSFQAPYCRDAAVHGTRIGFTLPRGAQGAVLVSMSIFDRWGNL